MAHILFKKGFDLKWEVFRGLKPTIMFIIRQM